MKKLIRNFSTENEPFFNRQLKWEFLKYEARIFTVTYTKHVAKEKRQQKINLENQLKKLKRHLNEDKLNKYHSVKNEFDLIYDHITEGIRIRSKCKWYEHGEKLTTCFLNLERQ